MKIKIYILVFLLVTIQNVRAQDNIALHSHKSFKAGEHLKYIIYYGPINGGIATMDLKPARFNGKPVLHSKVVARSTGITDKLYKVRDVYEAYMYEDTALPAKSIRDISEGNYKKYNSIVYNHEKDLLRSELSGIHKVPDNIRDMVSTFFYIRKIDYSKLMTGDIIKINTFFDDEVFPFDIRYRGKEKIKTKLGEFECIKLVPFVEPGRIFKTEEDMTIWISDDPNLVPIRVKFDLIVGSLKIDLISYEGLSN